MVKNPLAGTSMVVQWLRICAANAGLTGSIPGRGPRIPHAVWCSQKIKIKNKIILKKKESTCQCREPGFRSLVRKLRSHKSCGAARKGKIVCLILD